MSSHASANIRAYEKVLTKNLKYADLHRKMVLEQQNNQINKAEANPDSDFTAEESEYSGNRKLWETNDHQLKRVITVS